METSTKRPDKERRENDTPATVGANPDKGAMQDIVEMYNARNPDTREERLPTLPVRRFELL